MSTKGQETQGLNKKQRRRNARAVTQTSESVNADQEEVVQVQPTISIENHHHHQDVHAVPLATNGIQALKLDVQKPVENV